MVTLLGRLTERADHWFWADDFGFAEVTMNVHGEPVVKRQPLEIAAEVEEFTDGADVALVRSSAPCSGIMVSASCIAR